MEFTGLTSHTVRVLSQLNITSVEAELLLALQVRCGRMTRVAALCSAYYQIGRGREVQALRCGSWNVY